MDISSLTIFSEVMQLGSYTAVAKKRGVSASSISRTISSLEEELGLRLFQRTTRRLEPTEAGIVYHNRIHKLIDEFESAKLMAKDLSEQMTGTLRVSVPTVYCNKFITPLLSEFSERYPELSLNLMMSDNYVDLLSERVDVAIRLGSLSDSSYIAKRLLDMNFIVCASNNYIVKNGRPTIPSDVKNHECLIFHREGYNMDWHFKSDDNVTEDVPISGKVTINNSEAIRQCAVMGGGIALLPNWLIQEDLDNGKLINLFTDYSVTATDFISAIWLLYPSRSYLPQKVRIFLDFLTEKLNTDEN
ncbi:MAG: LysR family transcriptional regulator [Methylococcales bacterium]